MWDLMLKYIWIYVLLSCLHKFCPTLPDDGPLRLKHVASYYIINIQLCWWNVLLITDVGRIRRIFIVCQQSLRTSHHVVWVWCVGTSVLEEAAAPIFIVETLKLTAAGSSKTLLCTKLHSVMCQKPVILILTAVTTSCHSLCSLHLLSKLFIECLLLIWEVLG